MYYWLAIICVLLLVLIVIFHKAMVGIKTLPDRLVKSLAEIIMSRIKEVEEVVNDLKNEIDKR